MPAFAMVLATACWASTMIANKSILDLLAVTEINSLRFLIGTLLVLLVAASTRQLTRIRKVGLGPILMGLLEPGGSSLFMVWGIAHTSAVSASVIVSIVPVLVPLLGWIVLRERMRPSVLIGATIAVGGTILLVQAQSSHAGGHIKGDLLVSAGVLLVCANQLVGRCVAQAYGAAATISVLQLGVAALLSLIVLFTIERPPVYLANIDNVTIATVLFIGLMGGAIPFLLYNFSLRHLPVGQVALFIPLMGPLGAIMAWGYLDTPITKIDVIAITTVFIGVAMPNFIGRVFSARR